jgi:D-alanyl-D-alanine carboxypeptidase
VNVKKLTAFAALLVFLSQTAHAQSALDQRIQAIIDRPEFRHANFGIEIYSERAGKVIYQHNADQLFTAASTTKLVTEGTMLDLLGADYRFHTKVY